MTPCTLHSIQFLRRIIWRCWVISMRKSVQISVWDGVIGKHGVGKVNRNGLKKLAEDNLNAPQKQALASPRLHGRQGLKPGFSLDTSLFSALETL